MVAHPACLPALAFNKRLTAAPRREPMTPPDFEQVNQENLARLLDLAPEVGTNLGLPQRDDRWPDGSEEARAQTLTVLRDWVRALAALPAETLTEAQQLDRTVFSDHLKLVEFTHTEIGSRKHDPDVFSQVSWTFLRQLRSDFIPDEQRFLNLAARMRDLGGFLQRARSAVTQADPLWLEIAQSVVAEAPAMLGAIRDSAQEATISTALKDDVGRAARSAAEVISAHQQWLKDVKVAATPQWVLGTERMTQLCRLRGVNPDLAGLTAMGQRFVQECQVERQRAARRIVESGDVQSALTRLREDAPLDFEQGLARVRHAVRQSRTYVVEKDLCSMPSDERLDVMETPGPLRPLIPFAALMPGPRFAPQVSVYLVTRPGAGGPLTDLAMADVENTAIHEGYPGHHLQLSVANQKTGLLRDGVPLGYFADLSAGWATDLIEGWAHYCEEMMREEGYQPGPVARLQIAQDALWRAHRIVIDVGLSTGTMTVNDAIERLVEGVGMSRDAATAEVRRYTRSPGYQLCYLVGKDHLFKIRRQAKIRWRDKYSTRRFHDLVLGSGSVPLMFVEKQLG